MAKNKYIRPQIFNLYKPQRISSTGLLGKFKRQLFKNSGRVKIGHFGTLDPFACGVYLVGVGNATKFNNIIHDTFPKTYIGIGYLGKRTPTGDLTVEPDFIDEGDFFNNEISQYDLDLIKEKLNAKFQGKYSQVPPQYSATKFQGKALYEYAREGIKIEKPPVERFIHHFEILKFNFPTVIFRTTVSSGTYIRTMFEDMAIELGTVGVLRGLIRESIGPFSIHDSLRAKDWDEKIDQIQGHYPEEILPFAGINLQSKSAHLYCNGQTLHSQHYPDFDFNGEEQYVWVRGDENTLGLGRLNKSGLKTEILFQQP